MNHANSDLYSLDSSKTPLILYPRLQTLHDDIRRCQSLTEIAGEPHCMSLEGMTGAGKTRLVQAYAEHFPRVKTSDSMIVPVLYMPMPSPATIKDVASAGLLYFGDPAYERGTRASLTRRFISNIKEGQVKLVILDDFHHLIDKKTNHILSEVSDWLKVLIKETNVTFLVVGLEGEVEVILHANSQLSRLFATRETLRPFIWDASRLSTIQEFSRFVQYAEKAVRKPLSSSVPRTELLYRIHYATKGVVGNVMNILRFAAFSAEERGNKTLEMETLALAFEKRLAKHLPQTLNPFVTPVDQAFQATHSPTPTLQNAASKTRRRTSQPERVVVTHTPQILSR